MKTSPKKPKYVKLREAILAKALADGNDSIPSERALADMYDVSRITAKRALNSMAADNLVSRRVGQGTFLIREKAKIKVKLYVAPMPTELPLFFTEAAKRFSEVNPDIEVSVVTAHDLTGALTLSSGVKIACLPHTNFLADQNFLSPLQDLDGYESVIHNLTSQSIQQFNDKTYSLPFFLMPEMVGFNRSLARELGLNDSAGPGDWSEMMEWAKAMSGHSLVKGDGAAVFIAKNKLIMPVSFFLTASHGKHYIDESDGRVSLNFEHGEQWLNFFQSLSNLDTVKPFIGFRFSPLLSGEALFSNKIGPWVIKQSEQCGGMDNIGLAPIPPPEKNHPSFCEVLKWDLSLARDENISDKEKYAAWEFMKYLVGDDSQRSLVSCFSSISVNRNIYEEQQSDPRWYPFFQAMATGRIRNDHPIQNQINLLLHKYYEAAVFGKMDVGLASETFTNIANTLFELYQEGNSGLSMQFC